MTAPLLSNSWYRVAALKPRLRSHARLHRHRYRGEVWYLLQDPVSNRVHRFTPGARLIIAAMDGKRTVADLWELANDRLGEEAPTQDEVINLLGQLHAADLLQSDVTPDASEAFDRGQREEKALKRRSFMNPMAVRIPLWDPDAFLERVNPLVRTLWSRWGAAAWLAVVLPALILLPPHWSELTNNFSDRVLAANNLLLLWLVFPLIKALHEFGHATATKAGGGEVHDMGIILLVLIPVPYVEASAATTFKSKYERATVGAAGMLVELFLAAIAFYLWLLIEPGTGRAILFNVMVVAGVSTLVFNGNPLLRYDAYYILADLIEMPNLAKRALSYWDYVAKRYLFGMDDADQPHASRSEQAWLLFYGVASAIYRIMVTIAIAIFIAGEFFVIGVILAIWAVVAMAVVPLIKGVQQIVDTASVRKYRRRVISVTAAATAVLVLVLFVIPMPFRSSAEGVIWLSEEAMVRAGVNGFVSRLLVASGTRVTRGEALVESTDPALEAQLRLGEARVAELEASYAAQFIVDRAKANIIREQLESEKAALRRIRERADALIARAGADGVFSAPQAADMPGRFYRKGELLGYVVEKGHPLARVVVAQDVVDVIRSSTEEVRVRYVHRPDVVAEGKIVRQVPAGGEMLPSRALGTEGGGKISVDPRDQKGAKTLERMFQVDIELPGDTSAAYYGERVYVRFDHEKEPLALQWYRGIRLLFLTHFNV
jgi:putative peptide zinc metalloprotease protein